MSDSRLARQTKSGSEIDRLENLLTAVGGLCQQLTSLQKAVIEGNVSILQLSDILVDQAKVLEQALQQYRSTVQESFHEATQKFVSVIQEKMKEELDQAATHAFQQQLKPEFAQIESTLRDTREYVQKMSSKRAGWKLFLTAVLLIILTGAASSVLVTRILLPRHMMRMDDIRLAALSAGTVLMEAWPRLSEQERIAINQTLDRANHKVISDSAQK